MNINLEKTGDLTAQVHVQVEAADYKSNVKTELKKYAKDLKIPGFRPGKVPIGMVRKMAGIGLVIEEVQKVVNDNLNQYFQDEQLNILGDPLPTETKEEADFDINCEKDMDFHFEVGLAPEFDLSYDFDGVPAKYDIDIDDAYLNGEIDNLRDRFADVSQPESIEKGDIIFGKMFEVDENGETVEEGFEQTIPLNPARIDNEPLFEPFIGKAIDDSIDFDLFAVGETDEQIASFTFIDQEDLDGLREKKFKFEIKRLNRTVPAEMNEDFFNKAAGNFGWEAKEEGEAWDEASFKEKLKEAHTEEMKNVASQRFSGEIQKALLDSYENLEFPTDFLKKWLGEMDENKTAETIEEEFPEFKRSLTWSLIVEKLQKENESLSVTPEEVTESIQQYVRQSLAYSGQTLTQEQEGQYMLQMLQNREYVNQTYSRISSSKIFPFIEEQVDPALQAINATDFFKMIEDEKEAAEAEQKEKEAATEKEA